MDRLRSAVVVIAAVLGFLGLVLLGEAESSARNALGSVGAATLARALGSDAPRVCSGDRSDRVGALCAPDSDRAPARGRRSGGATR